VYENGKMRPSETIAGMRGRETKENDGGVDSTMIYCKNFHKCQNASQHSNNMIIKINKNKRRKKKDWAIMQQTRHKSLLRQACHKEWTTVAV
jgi:hypothetical protein